MDNTEKNWKTNSKKEQNTKKEWKHRSLISAKYLKGMKKQCLNKCKTLTLKESKKNS